MRRVLGWLWGLLAGVPNIKLERGEYISIWGTWSQFTDSSLDIPARILDVSLISCLYYFLNPGHDTNLQKIGVTMLKTFLHIIEKRLERQKQEDTSFDLLCETRGPACGHSIYSDNIEFTAVGASDITEPWLRFILSEPDGATPYHVVISQPL